MNVHKIVSNGAFNLEGEFIKLNGGTLRYAFNKFDKYYSSKKCTLISLKVTGQNGLFIVEYIDSNMCTQVLMKSFKSLSIN